jgi:hypothetical protein
MWDRKSPRSPPPPNNNRRHHHLWERLAGSYPHPLVQCAQSRSLTSGMLWLLGVSCVSRVPGCSGSSSCKYTLRGNGPVQAYSVASSRALKRPTAQVSHSRLPCPLLCACSLCSFSLCFGDSLGGFIGNPATFFLFRKVSPSPSPQEENDPTWSLPLLLLRG